MHLIKLPQWINPHLYKGKNFIDLSQDEIKSLQAGIKKFSAAEPDVSIVIPAWNEENNVFRTLSSLVANETTKKVEIIVINNNSTDGTQKVLDNLSVCNYFQPTQGITFARQMGLDFARGRYHLCADCDTFYPPNWIDLMIKPLQDNPRITGVYGRYSFLPPEGKNRIGLYLYELLTGVLIRLRKKNREYINVLGFNMGFVTEAGRNPNGFKVINSRKFDNAVNSSYYTEESEDGRMAIHLKTKGSLKLITDSKARVFTSSRRLMYDGGVFNAFINRLKLQLKVLKEYFVS